MLDFQRNFSQQQKQNQHERRRLFVLVLMLGIAFVLFGRLGNPSGWWFIDALSPSPLKQGTAIDNRLDAVTQPDTLPEDAFLMASENRSPKPESADSYFPGVKPGEFDMIRDDTPSRRDEKPVSLLLFHLLQHADPKTLNQWSLGPITYAQLFQQPSLYRGRLVSVSGIVRRVNWLELFPNDDHIPGYYQVWLWPSDNPIAPIVIYCLELPKGFPTGMEIAEQAEATGFFFKRWAYQAKDALRTAPEILAKTLQWDKRPILNPKEPAETWPIPLVGGVAVLASLAMALFIYLRTRPTHPVLPDRPPNFDVLETREPKEGTTDERA